MRTNNSQADFYYAVLNNCFKLIISKLTGLKKNLFGNTNFAHVMQQCSVSNSINFGARQIHFKSQANAEVSNTARMAVGIAVFGINGRRGRPRVLDGEKLAMVRSMYEDRKYLPDDICKAMRISRSTLYRSVSKMPAKSKDKK